MAAAFCFEIPFAAHGGPPGTYGMHTPSNSLLAHRYWGVTFDSLLFNRAVEASKFCDPRELPCILDTVHRRLVELLAVADSCLDTTVALLTREHEVWQTPADAPSCAFSSQPTERPRPLRLPMGECLDWVIHGTCGRQERCPQHLSHLIARIGNGNLPRTTERSSSTCAKRPKLIPLHG